MFPLLFWNLFTFQCYKHCSCKTNIILYIRFMTPLFWRNNTFTGKYHSNTISITILYLRIMVISFIWCSSRICIIKRTWFMSIIIFRIFILFILPFFRNLNTFIPQIVTNGMILIIFQLNIMLPLLWRNYSFNSQYHCYSLIIII